MAIEGYANICYRQEIFSKVTGDFPGKFLRFIHFHSNFSIAVTFTLKCLCFDADWLLFYPLEDSIVDLLKTRESSPEFETTSMCLNASDINLETKVGFKRPSCSKDGQRFPLDKTVTKG